MSPSGQPADRGGRRTGRRPGDQRTREAILAAARRRFGDRGFTGTTIRMVAADAAVDPALVLHYYSSKADLFAAAVAMPVAPSEQVAALARTDPDDLGEAILRTVVGFWTRPDARAAWLGLLRSAATDEQAARMLREFLTDTLFQPLAGVLDAEDGEYRVALAASQVIGLGIARYIVGFDALASASPEELVAAAAPVLQHYLTGDL